MRDSTFVYLHAGRTVGIDWASAASRALIGSKCQRRLMWRTLSSSSVCFYPISGVSLSPCLPWRADLWGIGPLFSRPSVKASLLFTREGFRMPLSLSLGTKSPLAKGKILWLLQSVVVHDQSFRKSVLTIWCVLVTTLCLRPFESITLYRRMWDTAVISASDVMMDHCITLYTKQLDYILYDICLPNLSKVLNN